MKIVNKLSQRESLHVDLTGQRVGKLTVLEKTDFRQGSAVMWMCVCDCGKEVLVRASHLTSKTRNSCGCLQIEKVKGHTAPNRKNPGEAVFNRLIRDYKKGAGNKNRAFSLAEEECYYLFTQNCFFCGKKPNTLRREKESFGEFLYNGIDRVDNEQGYIINNVVSACIICNERKHTLSYPSFYNKAICIYENIVKVESPFPLIGNIITPVEDGWPYLPGIAARNSLIRRYKNDAKDRNLIFMLTKEEATYLFKQNCFYCGVKPSRVIDNKELNGSYTYNGIDRVDNSMGYLKENCVPCCQICNSWKSNWTLTQFKEWITSIMKEHNFSSKIKEIPDITKLTLGKPFSVSHP